MFSLETSSRKVFCTVQLTFLTVHHALYNDCATSGITYEGGREELADSTVLESEMENNICDQDSGKMMQKLFKTTV